MFTRLRSSLFPMLLALCGIGALSGCPGLPGLDPQPQPQGVHWLRFAQITDCHINDDESPARAVRADNIISVSWRPQENYSTQVLDATLRVLNEHHTGLLQPALPLDFVIVTGDLTDGGLHNELRWFMETMDGRTVQPDSGDPDGDARPVAPEDNPKLAFQPGGLNPGIPWYTVYGNHDGLCIGTFGVDRRAPDPQDWNAPILGPIAGLLGLHLLEPSRNALLPTDDQSPAVILGTGPPMDADTLQLRLADLYAGPIVLDADRRFLSRQSFVAEHLLSTSQPTGHGFNEEDKQTGSARYSAHPKPGVPVRLVVLDTVAPDPLPGFPAQYGVMTREQFNNFVKPEIEAARAADEFVLLASHHPSSDFDIPYLGDTVKTAEFRRYLAQQPNIIAHICGHTHRHKVTAVPGRYPYYEIETASLIDAPQEARVLDLYYLPESGAIRLESRIVSHMEDPSALSAESYRRAALDPQHNKDIRTDPAAAQARAAWLPYPDIQPNAEGGLPLSSLENRRGGETDREFSITLPRPPLQ